jgi:hypothetical protein
MVVPGPAAPVAHVKWLGHWPMCKAPIVEREDNPAAQEPYVPRVMGICERGHRVTQPDQEEA